LSRWLTSLAAVIVLFLGMSGEALAQAGQLAPCPVITHLKFIEGQTYTVSTQDYCWLILFTNPGDIAVSLPAPGLIFAPGFKTEILSLGGGAITFAGLQDDSGRVHLINLVPTLTLEPGQGALLSVQEDLNWYAFTSGVEGSFEQAFACLATGTGVQDCLGTGDGNDVLAFFLTPPPVDFCLATGTGLDHCLATGTGVNDVLALGNVPPPPVASFCVAMGTGAGDCLGSGTGGSDVLAFN
jgi:hypothetical protein